MRRTSDERWLITAAGHRAAGQRRRLGEGEGAAEERRDDRDAGARPDGLPSPGTRHDNPLRLKRVHEQSVRFGNFIARLCLLYVHIHPAARPNTCGLGWGMSIFGPHQTNCEEGKRTGASNQSKINAGRMRSRNLRVRPMRFHLLGYE